MGTKIVFFDISAACGGLAKEESLHSSKLDAGSLSFAVGTRFELVVRLPVRQFSKLLVSATHPPHRKIRVEIGVQIYELLSNFQHFSVLTFGNGTAPGLDIWHVGNAGRGAFVVFAVLEGTVFVLGLHISVQILEQ